MEVQGEIRSMRDSFVDFALGLVLATVLVYLVMVGQFRHPTRSRIGPPFGQEVLQVLATINPVAELEQLVKPNAFAAKRP